MYHVLNNKIFILVNGIFIISSPEHSSNELIPWRSVRRPSSFHILNFSRTVERIYSNLATNFPYEVPTKYCYFWSRSEIQYGRPGLWLADTFSTSSQERLKGSTPNLPQMFFMMFQPSIVTFKDDPKSKMASLASDCGHIFNFWRRMAEGIYSKLATNVPYDILTKCC